MGLYRKLDPAFCSAFASMYENFASPSVCLRLDLNSLTLSLLDFSRARILSGDLGFYPKSTSNRDIPRSSVIAELYANSALGSSSSQLF